MVGLGKTLGFGGLTDFVDPRRNMLLGLSAGFLSGDLGNVPRYAMEGKQADDAYATQQKAEAERQQEMNSTVEWARNAFPDKLANVPEHLVGQLAVDLFKQQFTGGSQSAPASVQEYQFYANQAIEAGEPPMPYEEWRKGSNQTVRAGMGQPIPVRNSVTGETGAAMPMSDGTYMNPFTQQPFDQDWEFDPAWVAAQRAQGKVIGESTAGAQFNLPQAELTMNQTLKALDDIRAEKKGMDEQFGNIMGVPQQMTPAWPSTDKAKFQVAVQRGTNRAFMEARQMLKGGGQITDFESRKAEAAITSMELAMQMGDRGQFEKALEDFEQAVIDGYNKVKMQAGTMPSIGGGAAPAPAAPGGQTSTGLQWSIEP